MTPVWLPAKQILPPFNMYPKINLPVYSYDSNKLTKDHMIIANYMHQQTSHS